MIDKYVYIYSTMIGVPQGIAYWPTAFLYALMLPVGWWSIMVTFNDNVALGAGYLKSVIVHVNVTKTLNRVGLRNHSDLWAAAKKLSLLSMTNYGAICIILEKL